MMGVGTRCWDIRSRQGLLLVLERPGVELGGKLEAWEKAADSSAISESESDIVRSCGLPGSDVMEDWSSLSYLGFW